MKKILLEIRGGVLQQVTSTSHDIKVTLIDYDTNDEELEEVEVPITHLDANGINMYVKYIIESYNENDPPNHQG